MLSLLARTGAQRGALAAARRLTAMPSSAVLAVPARLYSQEQPPPPPLAPPPPSKPRFQLKPSSPLPLQSLRPPALEDVKKSADDAFRGGKGNPSASDLVSLLVKCGDVALVTSRESRVTLADDIVRKAVAHPSLQLTNEFFTTLLGLYTKFDKDMSVPAMLKLMKSKGVEPQSQHHLLLAEVYAQQGDVKGVRESIATVETLDRAAFLQETTFHPLIKTHLLLGNVSAARAVLDEMKMKSVVVTPATYCAVLNLCGRYGSPDLALEMFKRLREEKVRLIPTMFTDLMFALGMHGRLEEIKQLAQIRDQMYGSNALAETEFLTAAFHGNMEQARKLMARSIPHFDVFECLFRAFAARGDSVNVMRLLDLCADENLPVPFNAQLLALRSCRLSGNSPLAMAMLERMRRNGFKSPSMYRVALQSLAASSLDEADVKLRIKQIHDLMKGNNIPTLHTPDFQNALRLIWSTPGPNRPVVPAEFFKVPAAGEFTPTYYHDLIHLHANDVSNPKSMELMEAAVKIMLESGEHMTQKTYRILVSAHARRGNMEGVASLITSMKEDCNLNPADPLFYTPVIEFFAKQGDFDSAISILDSIQPSINNLLPLFNACAPKGDVDTALRLMQVLRKLNLRPDHRVYARLFEIYSKAGNYEGLLMLMQNLTSEVVVGSTSHVALQGILFESDGRKVKAMVDAMKAKGLYLTMESVTKYLASLREQKKTVENISLPEVFSSFPALSELASHQQAVVDMNDELLARGLMDRSLPVKNMVMNLTSLLPDRKDQINLVVKIQERVDINAVNLTKMMLERYITLRQASAAAELLYEYGQKRFVPMEMVAAAYNLVHRNYQPSDSPQLLRLLSVHPALLGAKEGATLPFDAIFARFLVREDGQTVSNIFTTADSNKINLSSLALSALAVEAMRCNLPNDAFRLLEKVKSYSVNLLTALGFFVRRTGSLLDALGLMVKIEWPVPLEKRQARLVSNFLFSRGDAREFATAVQKNLLKIDEKFFDAFSVQFDAKQDNNLRNDNILRCLDHLARVLPSLTLDATAYRAIFKYALSRRQKELADECFTKLQGVSGALTAPLVVEYVGICAQYKDLTNSKKAMDFAKESLKVDEGQRRTMAVSLLALGKWGLDASEELRRELPSNDAAIRGAMLQHYAAQGNAADALAAYDEAMALQKLPSTPAFTALVSCLAGLGDAERAKKILDDYLAHKPQPFTPAPVFTALLQALVKKGEMQEAAALFDRMTEMKLTMDEAVLGPAFVALVTIDTPRAVALAAADAPLLVSQPAAQDLLLRALVATGKLDTAIDVASKATQLRHDTMLDLLTSLAGREQVDEAKELVAHLKKVMTPFPGDLIRYYLVQSLRVAVRKGKGVDAVEGILDQLSGHSLLGPETADRMLNIWTKGGLDGNVFRMLLKEKYGFTLHSRVAKDL